MSRHLWWALFPMKETPLKVTFIKVQVDEFVGLDACCLDYHLQGTAGSPQVEDTGRFPGVLLNN